MITNESHVILKADDDRYCMSVEIKYLIQHAYGSHKLRFLTSIQGTWVL